jgi:hypothetical protein
MFGNPLPTYRFMMTSLLTFGGGGPPNMRSWLLFPEIEVEPVTPLASLAYVRSVGSRDVEARHVRERSIAADRRADIVWVVGWWMFKSNKSFRWKSRN